MVTEIDLLNEGEAIGIKLGKVWAKAAPRKQAKRLLAARLSSGRHSLRPSTVIRLAQLDGFDLARMVPADAELRDSFLAGFAFGASMAAVAA